MRRARHGRVLVVGAAELGRDHCQRGADLGHLLSRGCELAFLIGDRRAQIEDEPDQVVAGGVIEINHATILRPR